MKVIDEENINSRLSDVYKRKVFKEKKNIWSNTKWDQTAIIIYEYNEWR